jgi:eukaryotic-like serine/threonine-protein kinase
MKVIPLFFRQARSSLNHPHIITIYGIDRADGVHFIPMKYVDGKTLDHLIPRHGMRLNEVQMLWRHNSRM